MNYKIQFLAYRTSGALVSAGALTPLGSYSRFPTDVISKVIKEHRNHLDMMNMACGLVPQSIESNRLRVLIVVLDETDDPICYSEMYEYRTN